MRTRIEKRWPPEKGNRPEPGIQTTADEPLFEPGPLEENFTYAFRARAKNSAGYGGYSEMWVMEVV